MQPDRRHLVTSSLPTLLHFSRWPSLSRWRLEFVAQSNGRLRTSTLSTYFPLPLALSRCPDESCHALWQKLIVGALRMTNRSQCCHYLVRRKASRRTRTIVCPCSLSFIDSNTMLVLRQLQIYIPVLVPYCTSSRIFFKNAHVM
jgi:hypothetical protein